jgi:hypothetical protein
VHGCRHVERVRVVNVAWAQVVSIRLRSVRARLCIAMSSTLSGKWPAQFIWVWGFKGDGATAAFVRNRQRCLEVAPLWSQKIYGPESVDDLILSLPVDVTEVVRAAMVAPGIKWVEQNDLVRAVAVYRDGGLLLDGEDTWPFNTALRQLELLRTCELVLVNGNSDAQYVEPDIIAGHANDQRWLLLLESMCSRILRRRGVSRSTGPMWSICDAWNVTARTRGFAPLHIANRFMKDLMGAFHPTTVCTDPVFEVYHAATWGHRDGTSVANIPKTRTLQSPDPLQYQYMNRSGYVTAMAHYVDGRTKPMDHSVDDASMSLASGATGNRAANASLPRHSRVSVGPAMTSLLTPFNVLQHCVNDLDMSHSQKVTLIAATSGNFPKISDARLLAQLVDKPLRTTMQVLAALVEYDNTCYTRGLVASSRKPPTTSDRYAQVCLLTHT